MLWRGFDGGETVVEWSGVEWCGSVFRLDVVVLFDGKVKVCVVSYISIVAYRSVI